MKEEIKKELDRISALYEERKEKFYDYFIKYEEAEEQFEEQFPNGCASTEEEYYEMGVARVRLFPIAPDYCEFSDTYPDYFCIYSSELMHLSDLLKNYLDEDELVELFEGTDYEDYIEDIVENGCGDKEYQQVMFITAYYYCVKHGAIPYCNFSDGTDELHYNYNELELDIKKELDWIRDLFEERKTKFYNFIEKRDELEEQLEDCEDDEERHEIENKIYSLDSTEYHYDENSDTRYFCMHGDDFMDLFDLLEENLDDDELASLIERTETEGLIPDGETYDDEVEDYFRDTKFSAAYLYCVEHDVIPQSDFYSEDRFHYNFN